MPQLSDLFMNREVPEERTTLWFRNLLLKLARAFTQIRALVNGQLTFGDGVDSDNISGVWVSVTTAAANTDVAVTHNLGQIPVGFLVMTPPASGAVNNGATAWTTSQIFIRCSAASQTILIFILAQPRVL